MLEQRKGCQRARPLDGLGGVEGNHRGRGPQRTAGSANFGGPGHVLHGEDVQRETGPAEAQPGSQGEIRSTDVVTASVC